MTTRERLTISLDGRAAARVRQCGARARGGASGYLERLIREDELREAVESAARWYAARPDAAREVELDAVESEIADLPPEEQAAALRRLGLTA
jgi:hypothetical protein